MLLDQAYPHLETPRLLLNRDPVVSDLFRQELKKYNPTLYSWKWMDGIQLNAGDGKSEEFGDLIWHFINKVYPIGTGRIIQSCEQSFCINFVELGGGYRLHCTGYNPTNNTRYNKHCFLLQWLYLKNNWAGPVKHDGAKRLRNFIQYLSKAPRNPYSFVVFHPVGADLLARYSLHLASTGYRPTGHSTRQLAKLYKYWLKAKPTKQLSEDGFDTFYRVDSYQPTDPIYTKDQCPYRGILEDGTCEYYE